MQLRFWRRASERRLVRQPMYFRPLVEGMEDRVVPSATSLGPALAAPAVPLSNLINITGINVTNVAVTGANQLTATLNVAGQILGQAFTLPNVQVPITLTGVGTSTSGTPILHLSLQLPDLNVLGLHVQLDNCNNGPVTVDITAIPSSQPGGGLLGDLLSGLGSTLNSGGLLGLTGANLTGFTGAIQQALNGILGQLVTAGGGAATTPSAAQGPNTADLVNLHLDPINLDVLGLDITTSQICLDIYAQRGGGLLGNLLYSVDHLLSSPGNPVNAIEAQLGKILNVLNGL